MQKIIESYQKNFKSPIGAYVYIFLNQYYPEFFTVSSKSGTRPISDNIEKTLKEASSLNEVLDFFTTLPQQDLDTYYVLGGENDFNKKNVLKTLNNLKYANIDFSSFECIEGIAQYNEISPFITNKKIIEKKLKEVAKALGLKEIKLNYNFSPNDFINTFIEQAQQMCEIIGLDSSKLGNDILQIQYKCNVGDFTGFIGRDKEEDYLTTLMVINKTEVFAHEWIHFIDSSLGKNNYFLTDLIDKVFPEKRKEVFDKVFSEYSHVQHFKKVLETKEESVKYNDLEKSLVSAAHFYKRYAKDKDNFEKQIIEMAINFKKEYLILGVDKALDKMQESLQNILENPYPTRYFSFLKAQAVSYVHNVENKKHEANPFLTFAKTADNFLQLEDYTQSTVEMFARTFEAFLFNKFKEKNIKSSLVAKSYDSDFYPQGKVRESFNLYWEILSKQISDFINKSGEKKYCATNIAEFKRKKIEEETKISAPTIKI